MSRAIVHLDMDCFYAQVEIVKRQLDPRTPLAVRQKGLLVTCNYAAREKGLRKCISGREGVRLCPELVVVPGEDLHPYRRASDQVNTLLRSYGAPVEKLGLDENYLDVTDLVQSRLEPDQILGHSVPMAVESCDCPEGTHERLAAASHLADEMRSKIKSELGLTCCAGVAHNKLLAKLVGSVHKPDQQTTVFPCSSTSFMSTLESVKSIPGIGSKTAHTLSSLGIESVLNLQECQSNVLEKTFGVDIASKLKKLSLGIDNGDVKSSGRPLSIGIEDSFKVISVINEVQDKFNALLIRLVLLMEEDGRRPGGIKVTLRQISGSRTTPHRETRQCHLPHSLFSNRDGTLRLVDGAHDKLMTIIMRLFHKSVNLSKPFQLTLLGLAFTKFQEHKSGKSSIANYLINDVSVQSMINLQNETDIEIPSSSSFPNIPLDGLESEAEPSPKKLKRLLYSSPNKLRVAELNLNTTEKEQFKPTPMNTENVNTVIDSSGSCSGNDWELPPDIDKEVFSALPTNMQEELRLSWNCSITQTSSCRQPSIKEPHNSIARYFIQNK